MQLAGTERTQKHLPDNFPIFPLSPRYHRFPHPLASIPSSGGAVRSPAIS